ncbi:MAG: PQQ-binding-like beta-propeller repeat protein [Vicinamibacteria bacterium]
MVLNNLALVATLLVIAPEQGFDWSRPRELPSLVKHFQIDVEPCALAVQGGTLFILAKDRLEAHNAETGALLWEQKSVAGDCPYNWQQPLQLMGDVVVAAAGDQLFLVEGSSGRVRQAIALGGRMIRLAGPPIVVEIIKGKGNAARTYELLSVDLKTGQVVGRRPLDDSVSDLDVFGDVAVVSASVRGKPTHETTGLGLPGLNELWQLTGRFYGAELIGGVPYLMYEDWARSHIIDFHRLEPRAGRLGTKLPPRASGNYNNNFGMNLPFELEIAEATGDKVRLRRNGVADAKALWTTELPGIFTAWAREGERLYLHCGLGGRGALVVLDWTTGAVRDTAYSLPAVQQIAPSGEDLILAGEAVVAVSGKTFGPPEASTVPVAGEVTRILARPMAFWNLGDAISDLQALGPGALKELSLRVEGLEALPLQVAAIVLGAADFRPAAAALASRLRSVHAEDKDPREAVLRALSRIGGAKEVEAVAALLGDRSNPAHLRRQSFTTLASIGTPEATAAIDRFLPPAPAPPWWDPRTWWDAMQKPARTEKQEIEAAITEQFFLFDAGPKAAKFTLNPARPGTYTPAAGHEERLYQLLIESSPHNDQYQVVVRKLGGRWIVREISDAMRLYH